MSIFSPPSSSTIFLMRLPRTPTQAPTASTLESIELTAIFVRWPGSRANALISIVRSPTSGHFALKQPADQFRVRCDKMIFTGAGVSRTSRISACIRSPTWCCSPGICSDARHDPFDPAEVHDHRAAFKPGDRAGHDRADAVFVFFVNAAALVLADELDHHLLDGLAPIGPRPKAARFAAAVGGDVAGSAIQSDRRIRWCLQY